MKSTLSLTAFLAALPALAEPSVEITTWPVKHGHRVQAVVQVEEISRRPVTGWVVLEDGSGPLIEGRPAYSRVLDRASSPSVRAGGPRIIIEPLYFILGDVDAPQALYVIKVPDQGGRGATVLTGLVNLETGEVESTKNYRVEE